MLIQLKHINFKPVSVNVEGEQKKLLVVEVQSKGEKTTGEKEFVYVGTERLKDALQKRRFALKHDPDAYVFGTEDGRHQKDFRRMWRELFKLAGLKWGRDKGLVWHAPRHEFCSRTAENTGDPVVAQELARNKDLRTPPVAVVVNRLIHLVTWRGRSAAEASRRPTAGGVGHRQDRRRAGSLTGVYGCDIGTSRDAPRPARCPMRQAA